MLRVSRVVLVQYYAECKILFKSVEFFMGRATLICDDINEEHLT